MAKTVNLTLGERERIRRLIEDRVGLMVQQPCLDFTSEDQEKNEEQAGKILALLKSRGEMGATNVELNAIAINHTGRVSDLRAKGHVVCCKRDYGRVFRYRLGESCQN
jgi:hypothetical protein